MRGSLIMTALLLAVVPGQAQAAKLCGWFVETAVGANGEHDVQLWLESDERITFDYEMTGKGFTRDDGSSSNYSPGGGSMALEPGTPNSPWTFGSVLVAGMHLDIVAEIHASKAKLFDDGPTPLLGKFVYQRAVTEKTEKPPAPGPHQCFEAKFPETDYR
jgi:hypothetical protein